MDKKIFEDLPSTKTPINSSNLNEMQSNIEKSVVIISATEPTTSERVWIKKSKNLFNKDNIILDYRLGSDGLEISHSGYFASEFIEVQENVNYVTNYEITAATRRIAFYDSNKAFISDNTSSKTFVTPANTCYLRLAGEQTLLDTAQLEQGTTSTSYEAYIEPKIYLKSENGVFEEYVKKTKTKTIWQGVLYETNSSITLTEALKKDSLYIFTFYGLSSSYLMQFPFTYKGGSFQVAYYDGTNYFRMRLDITSEGKKVTVNSASINNASNTALIAIEKVC